MSKRVYGGVQGGSNPKYARPYVRPYARRYRKSAPLPYRSFKASRPLRSYPDSGIETKFFDTALGLTAIQVPIASTTWSGLDVNNVATNLCFNSPTQGTGASNREGRKITMESLQINGLVSVAPQIDQAAADSLPIVKIWIVMDKQTNGGAAGTGILSQNVYTNPSSGAVGGLAPLRNMLYTKRYKVLKEITVDLQMLQMTWDGTNVEQAGMVKDFSCFLNLKGTGVEYLGNAGTVADIVDNGLFILAACSNAATAPQIVYNARLRFRG